LGLNPMKTFSPKPSDVERHWYVVDAQGAVLGRLATQVATLLRGKHKPIFAPHVDTGDHVIVVNAKGVRVTGAKEAEKELIRHSGFPGGLRRIPYSRVLAERPSMAVQRAVRGMLPKNRLGRAMLKKLSVYDGPEHPHQAQMPSALGLGEVPKWTGLPAPTPPKARPARAKAAPAVEEPKRAAGRSTRPAAGTRAKTGTSTPARSTSRRTPAPRPKPKAKAKAEAAPTETSGRRARARSKDTGATESTPSEKTRGLRRRRSKES
jgi:large subunit ribosomal protein L13